MQDVYAEKLIKEYEIFINQKASSISLFYQSLMSYDDEVDSDRVHEYRQKMRSICYFVIIIRSDMIKVASKLAKFLTNFAPYHLIAVDYCIRYMHSTRHLVIKFDVSKSEDLIVQTNQIDLNSNSVNQINKMINQINSNKQVFETSIDAFFANEEGRRSDEDYTFKLFDDLID